ncbi:PCMD domain-containing protein [Bacteroides sp.]|uniref:PCMD domain-containing protein n=1 Tax=Bacteroides sp. TaxID=29523 RepID=UPI0023CBEAF2|nr:PCMD domain-containing protein [Bacteroides sp.]MDE5711421.1 PCMD domain-containing protein [Bacteroides sp.]MDE6214876.1 PCMD domain-containing protein [Bacteroides sp.]
MKLNKLFILYSLFGIWMTSCIKDEALNAEADITGISFSNDILANSYIELNSSYDDIVNAYPIRINVKEGTNLNGLAPEFELTPGATIEPASGSRQDFTKPVKYTVTSEDKKWHRTYSITIREQKASNIPTMFHFEQVRLSGGDKYHEFYEEANGEELKWASGNPGFKIAMPNASIADYPTVQYAEGKVGKCVKLETRTTGSLGAMVNMPIAAGNLFLGNFNIGPALSNPLGATRFGTPFYSKPVRLTGYYKYKAGEKFYENGEYTSRKDIFNIYAFFYETTEDVETLDGTLPKLNYEHPNMVALALISNPHETDKWEYFNIPFDYDRYGKTIDNAKLAAGKYKLGITFASSKNGDTFEGAPGSTLLIDEVELIYE